MSPANQVQRISSAEDLEKIEFLNGLAEIEVPIEHLHLLPLKNEDRNDSARLRSVEETVRHNGYNNLEPVVAYVGRRGRWVIIDGGHRITAARHVSKEFLTNLFGPKVRSIFILLHQTPISNSRVGHDEE